MKYRQSLFGLCALAALTTALFVYAPGGCSTDFTPAPGGGGAGGFLDSGRTLSFFRAIQVDPRSEDSAGPQFVVAEDLNADGLTDLISAWNQSQPVQIHLQRRTAAGAIRFETTILAGSIPVVSVAGLAVTDFDQDGRLDIAVLAKETLLDGPECLDPEDPAEGLAGLIVMYFGPADTDQVNQALAWTEVSMGDSFLLGSEGESGGSDVGGFTGLAVGDIDLDGDMDLIVPWNSTCGGGTTDVVVFTNNGPGPTRDGTWTAGLIPDSSPQGTAIKSVALGDVDRDGDLDIVATFPDAPTMNVRWYRNPAMDTPDDYHISDGQWQTGIVGQISSGADTLRTGDLDGDGVLDVVVRSTGGKVLQWLKGPEGPTTAPIRAIPWQVYTIAEYTERTPETIAVGDLNNDGQLEVVASAEGGLSWFIAGAAEAVYDQWRENLIVDDQPVDGTSNNPATTDPNVAPGEVGDSTIMNSILIVDLDGDGENDLIVPFDRSGLSGLTNDALVWFQNIR